MAQNLIIVESPAKAKTIEKYLGGEYEVIASMGHLRDLPKKTMGVDIENNFTDDTNDVHRNYINTVLSELELKLNATEYLLDAIDYYENYQNSTGNEYAQIANDLMNQAIEFQKVRNDLVKDNPDLFK